MKFLIDENVPQSLIQFLTSSGYDCLDIKTTQRRGLSDEGVIQWARTEDRIILTYDKDFLFSQEKTTGTSCIVLRFPGMPPKDVIPYLSSVLAKITIGDIKLPVVLHLGRDALERVSYS
jgi:predicted nuclease of predicted toxin-antitoxin system